MKDFAYARREKESLDLYSYETGTLVPEDVTPAAIMASRLDFNIKKVPIPPVDDDEVRGLLGYKLRGLYPGDPGDTQFDFRVISQERKRFAIMFITSRTTAELYKNRAGKTPVYLPYQIVEPIIKADSAENMIFLFWNSEWVDVLVFDNKGFTSSTAIRREKEIFLDVLKLKNIMPQSYMGYKCVSISPAIDTSEIREKSEQLFKDTGEKEFLDLETLLRNFKPGSMPLFRAKRSNLALLKKARMDVLVLPVVILMCLLFNKYVDTRMQYKVELQATMEKELIQSVILKKNQQLIREYNTLQSRRPMDNYLLMSEISKIMAWDAILTSFRTDNIKSTFNLEGVAYDPDKFITKFQENKYFSSVVITDITPDEVLNKSRFKLTGEFHVNK